MKKDKDALRLIVMNNCKELGTQVDLYLQKKFKTEDSFIVPIEQIRFNNGEGKIIIKDTIRDKEVYILTDMYNYGITYKMYGKETFMTPDEYFQDLKRVICSMSGHASKINVVMPFLYASRQHRRKGRESLDCAISLQELERLGVSEIITFDAHDPNIQNAIPLIAFDNFYPTAEILEQMIDNKHINLANTEDLLVISPDTGAMDRARFYADILGCDMGFCYKRRDLSKIVNGKNPIVAHEYLGKDVAGKNILIVDDMIASGGSILECALNMKAKGAKDIYLVATFSLFTEGIKLFQECYKKGIITKVYSTNLSYIPNKTKKQKWLTVVDCSDMISEIIYYLSTSKSITQLLNGKKHTIDKIKEIKNELKKNI